MLNRIRFPILAAVLLLGMCALSGCMTAGTNIPGTTLPALTPQQINATADSAIQIVNQLETAGKLTAQQAAEARAKVTQYQTDALLAAQLTGLLQQLLQIQSSGAVAINPPAATPQVLAQPPPK